MFNINRQYYYIINNIIMIECSILIGNININNLV